MVEENSKRRLSLIDYTKIGIESVYKTFLRFPLTILLFVALAVTTIYRIEIAYRESMYEIIDRLTGVLLLGVVLSLAVQMLFERYSRKQNILYKIAAYSMEIAIIVGYYFYLFPNTGLVSVERLLLISISLILAFLFIPYLFRRENFELYITSIMTRLVTTVFFTTVLALGLTATLFAIESLLYNELDSNFYSYIWILAWSIFAPIFFLYGLPKREEDFSLNSYNKVLEVLLLYIILPILSIFTVVLYIYFGKILITQVWPEGIVSYLVLSYTAVGLSSIFLISPLKLKNKWARIFISIFTKVSIPLLVIMFMSIGIRIGEYGFTENRYYILIIGIWATFAILFVLFNKGKNNIVLPISLAIVAFLIVIGPWSAFNVSVASQSERFYNILIKYDMIDENGKVNVNDRIIEDIDKKEIIGILRYFEYSHEPEELTYLPSGFGIIDMERIFGFSEYMYVDDYSNQISYYRDNTNPLVITGYDVLYNFKSYNQDTEKEFDFNGSSYKVYIKKDFVLTISLDGDEIYQVSIQEYVKSLHEKYGYNTKGESIAPEDLIFIDGNEEAEVMFVFNQIYGTVINEEVKLENIEVEIYINLK
ncbi:MAG: DUF4153 domain-containing protein [Vulcanibacillus sp.]